MNKSLVDHIIKQSPTIDAEEKFVFLKNLKVSTTSVLKSDVLKGRCMNLYLSNAKEYLEALKTYPYEKVFKFTIVRHPVSRFLSAYHALRNAERVDIDVKDFIFGDFIYYLNEEGSLINIFFSDMHVSAFYEGKQYVDYIAKLENIESDWKYISSVIGCDSVLPKLNITSNKDSVVLDYECLDILRSVYKKDFELFDYE